MAVDYTRLGTYQTAKNTYKTNINLAKEQDKTTASQTRASRIMNGISYGTNLLSGLGFWPSVAGAALGFVFGSAYDIIDQTANPIKTQQNIAFSNLNTLVTDNTTEVIGSQQKRNTALVNADYLINSTRSNFESTYGKNSFNMLEATIQSLLDMDSTTAGQQKMSTLLGGLKQDEIIGQIETRLLSNGLKDTEGKDIEGRITQAGINALNSAYIDISSLGNQYVEYLYNSILNSDTEIGDSANQLSASENQSLQQLEQNLSELTLSNQQKFAELFLNQRSSNISNAQNLGETEASVGASGIKASKASRTSVNAQKLQADIANASYGIMLNSYKKQLDANIKSNQISRAQVYYSSRQQMNALKRQVKASVNESINSYLHGGAQLADTIASSEMDIDDSMAAVQAGKEILTENKQAVTDTRKYVYTTNSATA